MPAAPETGALHVRVEDIVDRVPSRGVATDIHGVFRAWPEGVSARHCW
jgi:hypothetical protein